MSRSVFTAALDLALGFGAAALFVLLYGMALGAAWPHVFGAAWPSLGADATRSLFRARAFDAVFGVGFGSLLAVAARRGWIRRPDASSLMVAAGIVLYAFLDAYGARNFGAAVLESPLPWAVAALTAVSSTLARKAQSPRHEA